MNTDTSKYKQRLEEEKAVIENELKSISVKDVNNPDMFDAARKDVNDDEPSDRTETAAEITDFEENTSITSSLDTQLLAVNDALARIENNTYGKCKVCDKDIEEDRLDANPSAATCKDHMNE